MTRPALALLTLLAALAPDLRGQKPPYDVFPPADPPYYRVRYEATGVPGAENACPMPSDGSLSGAAP